MNRVLALCASLVLLSACGGGGGGGGRAATAMLAMLGIVMDRDATTLPEGDTSFRNFETVPNRAVALSADEDHLFVLNVPDARLEIFAVAPDRLDPVSSVLVGLDPISLALSPDQDEVWVVNHLSDSVSVVDVSDPTRAHVTATLQVGDEPRDIVFAGTAKPRAFVTAVRRGQNHPIGIGGTLSEAFQQGIGRADLWVFDVAQVRSGNTDAPEDIVQLFSDKPGSLAVSRDRNTVFVGVFSSGNQTTVVNARAVCGPGDVSTPSQSSAQDDGPCMLINGLESPGGNLAPNVNQVDAEPNPKAGVLVEFDPDTGGWLDGAGRDFRNAVGFSLPDFDMFKVDANSLAVLDSIPSAGTLNFGIAIHPVTGQAFMNTIDAINTNRFLSNPGAGAFPNPTGIGGAARTADPVTGKTLNGHLYESRIAIVDDSGSVLSRHLNKHIDYEVVPSPPGVRERSVASPHGLSFSPGGETLFVAALGSRKIVPFETAALLDDSFEPDASTHIELSGRAGPTDMAITADGSTMFVYKRFDNAIARVDLVSRTEVSSTPLFNPEPRVVREGRPFFYDARLTSSNGEASCVVCHPGGDKDDLAWDLGSPFGGLQDNPNFFVSLLNRVRSPTETFEEGRRVNMAAAARSTVVSPTFEFNPIKGPLTVLTLRGIDTAGPMLWRGDATNAMDPMDERMNLIHNFNALFPALLGREDTLLDEDFELLADFILSLRPPPNPYRALNNTLIPFQDAGRSIFVGEQQTTDGQLDCVTCHVIDQEQGFFGTGGELTFEGGPQFFKVPQLRSVYDKVGMFGVTAGQAEPGSLGPQVKGSGTLHDGSLAGSEAFETAANFDLDQNEVAQVSTFLLAFDANFAPVVGQQVTLGANPTDAENQRLSLLMARSQVAFDTPEAPPGQTVTECELVAQGRNEGVLTSYLYLGGNMFRSDANQMMPLSTLRARAAQPTQQITFTCVYPTGGERMGLDRDGDGVLNQFD